MIIYTDVDSTVLNFNAPWEAFVRERGVAIPHEGFLQGHCRLTDAVGIEPELEAELLADFFASDRFYDIPAIEGAPEALQRLHRAGWSFVAVTACPNGECVSTGRKNNLERVLGVPFEAVHTTGVGGCKRDLLASFSPTVWVEDHIENAIAGHELGYRTFLVDQKHNSHHNSAITRVNNWGEIADALEGCGPCTVN